MKVNLYLHQPAFKGVREDRNTTAQLKQNNDYSLTEPNQRRINKAIENLAKQRGEENIKFLLDIGENIQYQTNIENGKATKNEWKAKLKGAAEESLAHSNPILREKYQPEIKRVFDEKKELTTDEKAILAHKKSIMRRVDLDSIKDNPNENIRNLERNMDYFITSTETPVKQKRYVMGKLDYLMSPNYKINPQLENKKTQVLAEMMNDLVVNTPESKVPNMKAVNQKSHGMCAAISIARKAVAYEDKPNYVDALLSELDAKDTMEVYDRQNLGSGERVPVKKTFVDFDYAQQKGYRIIDASTLQWMNVAGMYGAKNEGLHEFNAFDKNNFDAFHDSFFLMNMSDEKLKKKQNYYQALTKAKEDIGSVKSSRIKKDVAAKRQKANYSNNLALLSKYNNALKNDIKTIVPDLDKNGAQSAVSELINLYKPTSEQIEKNPQNIRKYSFIPNEENSQKTKKVKRYIKDKYSDKIDEKALDNKAENIVDYIQTINMTERSLKTSSSQAGQVANARRLYEAESIYRASTLIGLAEDDNLTDNLIRYNIPDRETRISEGYAKVIDRIEKKNDKKLIEHFANVFGLDANDKDSVLENLNQVKNSVDNLMTDGLDSLYNEMGYGGRKELLLNEIENSKESIKSGDKEELKHSAVYLHTKEDKNAVLKEYDKLAANLNENPNDEKAYTEAFNKMGYKSQINAFIDIFGAFAKTMMDSSNPESAVYQQAFKASAGLSEDASIQDVADAVNSIGDRFNAISANIETAAAMLEVPNEDGSPYFTVSGRKIIVKKMENEGRLIPKKDMAKLQDRFTRIDKLRSQDEFSSRQGKISDPSLYKLSKEEKIALKQIDKKLNFMYSDVVRNLNYQYREIKEPLEKLANYVGTNEGMYWVQKEGSSGLYGDQQVKIFEQLTDKPYHEVEDIDEAVDLIKNGVHSGVSSSSVFHDRMGGHAQYVADVKENEKNGKTILFHDNTWGASEHENIWTDSEGLLRTDYSDRRGGELGYITDENWRNGNYVDNLTHKKGHITPENVESKTYNKINPRGNEFDFALMSGIILPGENPEHKDIAGSIKDTIYIPDSAYIDTLQGHAKSMTKQQIQKAIFRNETAGKAYRTNFSKIMKRLDTTPFSKGIDSLDDYNRLSDSDILKVSFEKAAVREAYPDASMYKELTSAKSVKDIEKIKSKQKEAALYNFNYAFGKTPEILLYPAYEHSHDMSVALYTVLNDNGIKLKTNDFKRIMKNISVYEKDEKKQFNGSLKDTINFMVTKAGKQFDEVVPESENKEAANKQFTESLKNILEENMYFSKSDLKQNTDKAAGIRNWIDEKFNPQSDEEFVQIYRNLQDMKTSDFNKLTIDVTDKQLGIKNITGYDVLTKVKAANSQAEDNLRNVLFYDEYSKDMDLSKTKPAYKYQKTERKARGAFYIGERTFDDLYRTMNMSLSSLDLEKQFNEYKDINFRKYQVIPAYPKIDLGNDPAMEDKIKTNQNIVEQSLNAINSQKNVLFDYKLVHSLDNYRKNIPSGRKLTPVEYRTINNMAGAFITQNYDDPDIQSSVNATQEITSLDRKADISEFNKHIDVIVKDFKAVEAMNSAETLHANIKAQSDVLKYYFDTIINTSIPPKYHRILREDAKNWVQAEIKTTYNNNGLDENKDFLKLYEKVSKYEKAGNEKSKSDDFAKVTNAVMKAKLMKMSKNPDKEKLQIQLDRVDKYADNFINKHVDKEYSRQVKSAFDEYKGAQLSGRKPNSSEQADSAREKFAQDFKKYHLTAHPQEILNNFLLMSAKDAEPVKQRDVYKKYLENELDLAKFIDIQSSLMEAVKTGNAAQVKNYFDDYYVYPDPNSKTPVSMNSDTSIDYMVRSLILEDNTKTGKMFVEKLGLGDRVMDIESKIVKQLKPEENIDAIGKIMKDTNDLAKILSEEMQTLGAEIDGNDYISKIDESKQKVIEKTKDMPDKDIIKPYLESMDEAKTTMVQNPGVPRSVLLAQYMNNALTEISTNANKEIEQNQNDLKVVNLMYKFLTDLHLPEYSKGYKIQQELKSDYENIQKYNQKVLSEAAQNNDSVIIKTKDD